MSAVQYPFIDIAVHPRVRERFANGEAIVLFSADMQHALWANGRGADLFGNASIYDFLDQGPNRQDVSFRQLQTAAQQLRSTGEEKSFAIRVPSGFQRIAVQATAELIEVETGERAVLFSAPIDAAPPGTAESAKRMIEGFDDPDTHIAVLDENGHILAASAKFGTLGITPHTARTLVVMAGSDAGRLIKRPVPTGKGYLPAAIGKLSENPILNLAFVVETIIGRLDPTDGFETGETVETSGEHIEIEVSEAANDIGAADGLISTDSADSGFAEAIDAVADITDIDNTPEDIADPVGDESESVVDDITSEVETAPGAAEEQTAFEPQQTEATQNDLAEDATTASAASDLEGENVAEEITASAEAGIEQADDAAPEQSDFVFSPAGRATRFVWKIDATGRFSEISGEFAEAVGPHAADICGFAFSDVAALFNLDPGGKIAELLGKRDTWSGKTIFWPVEGTALMVPIDLAALPTYTRSRDFDGFRGFGIVRLADAIEDPNAIGLTLTGKAPEITETAAQPDIHEAEEIAENAFFLPEEEEADDIISEADVPPTDVDDAQADDAPAGVQPEADDVVDEDIADTDTGADDAGEQPSPASADEWPAGEPPALRIVETPQRRHSDKVIRLEERRLRVRDGLSAGEQAAFREIARQLDQFVNPELPASTEESSDTENRDAPVIEPDETVAEATPLVPEEMETASAAAGVAETDDVSDLPAIADGEEKTDENENISPPTEEPESEDDVQPELPVNLVPPRSSMTAGLSADIVDQMPVALLVHSGDQLIHGNPEFLRLTGYDTLDELDNVGGLDALLQRQELEDKTREAGGMLLVRADDTLIPVTARLQSIRWEQSTALMLALMPAAEQDEAKRKHDERGATTASQAAAAAEEVASLKVEVEELHSILETATDGVVILGAEGEIRSMNRSASALFNYDNEEIRGKPFVMLFAHESQRSIMDYLGGLAGHGVASVLNDGREVIGREASGGFLPLFMTIGRLSTSNGYCAVIRDITQWKRTEEELRNAKRAAETANAHKSDFLARVSHEIRTPLNAIIGFADMMSNEHFGALGHSRYAEYANDIGRSGRHVLDIVNDLLDISKIEAGEMDLDFVAVGLNETVSEAVSLVQPQANSQRVIIRTALSQDVPQVVADLRSVKQIVLNILSNAIRFTPSGGQIVVSTAYEASGSVILRIRDTGIGMTRAELEQAMKPFRQVAGGARKRGDGTGLGLPLTKAMVDANRAAFSIHSAPDEGTLVEVTFPSPRVLAD